MDDADPIQRLNAALEGRYRIERELGAGGMATVYLAEDVRHHRRVALKVLKPELAAVVGSERFLAEIETTANLQHPHILPLFDSGEADGLLFYVMPYVEGESLRERVDREQQLPVDDAVRIATNLAEALDYAHRQGVIHRDIKPANVMLQDGKPVISDFGIALAVNAAGGGRLTETGLSLGTPHYMSPEQATGDLNVGPATDIYALGCVLYEMLVGEPPFTGSTPQAVLGKIITGKVPSVKEERSSVPSHVDAVIRQALAKVPADRFRDSTSLIRALGDPGFCYGEVTSAREAGIASGPSRALLLVLAITVLYSGGTTWALLSSDDPEPAVRAIVNVEPAEDHGLALSPDGQLLILAEPHSLPGEPIGLVARPLGSLTSTRVSGSEGTEVHGPSVSHDGTEVAFFADGDIKVVSLSSGTVRTVASFANGRPTWGPDGYIYYTTAESNIARVPAMGGATEWVTELTEGDAVHAGLRFLPGGDRGVLDVARADGSDRIEVLELATGQRRVLTAEAGAHAPHVTPSGHLLFGTTDGRIMAAPFDADDVELTGPAVPVVDGLNVYEELGGAWVSYSVSDDGKLTYVAGSSDFVRRYEFVWVNRSGQVELVDAEHTFFGALAAPGWQLSPDDMRLAYKDVGDQGEEIWVKELPDGPRSRLTFTNEVRAYRPTWTPDGQWITYFAGVGSDRNVWMKQADGIGEPVLLLDEEVSFAQGTWSPDGEWLILRSRTRGSGDIMAFRPDADTAAVPLIATEFEEFGPAVSPDGRWLAYSSNESGVHEIYVRSFPDVNATRFQISTDGGLKPVWAHSGRELFFVAGDEMVSASFSAEGRVTGLTPLFTLPDGVVTGQNGDFYDVTSDDQRFLMARGLTNTSQLQLVLVLNFFEELERLVPN